MTYAEYKKEYKSLLTTMLGYSPKEAGSNIYCSKLADLVEANPESWEDKADEEMMDAAA